MGCDLESIGIQPGETLRYRPLGRTRWEEVTATGLRLDGSVLVHDTQGAARSLQPDRLQVRRPGPRGRLMWIGVDTLQGRWVQLELFNWS